MQPFLALITPIGNTEQPPLGIWGPNDPRPSNPIAGMGPGGNFPGAPATPPGYWGPNDPRPSNPIAGMRPDGTFPDGAPPLVIWGPGDPRPTPPIVIPPTLPPTMPEPDNRPIEWKTAWTAETGWVVIGIPQGPVPTPSK